MIQLIRRTLDGKVPMTDDIRVSEPNTRPFEVDLVYYLPRHGAESAAVTRNNAERAVEEYIQWQTERMGRDINPDKLTFLMRAAGVKRIERHKPDFEVIEENEVAAIITPRNVIYGGLEDE
jgi:phage-related baseplate assembly protein